MTLPNSSTATTELHELIAKSERIDAEAWVDQFNHAAPEHVKGALGLLAERQTGDLVLVRSHIPFCHFRMVTGLGAPTAVDATVLKTIDAFFAKIEAESQYVVCADSAPQQDIPHLLKAHGYQQDDAWDRVVCLSPAVDVWTPLATGCELVTEANQSDWFQFILDCYQMPPIIGDWLKALVGRSGWIHALRRGADGKVVMVRSLFHDSTGNAWLGIDAPVPGVMAPCFADDQHVTATLLVEAARQGAKAFFTDIEAPSVARDTEAYRLWGALNFKPLYKRQVYVKNVIAKGNEAQPSQ